MSSYCHRMIFLRCWESLLVYECMKVMPWKKSLIPAVASEPCPALDWSPHLCSHVVFSNNLTQGVTWWSKLKTAKHQQHGKQPQSKTAFLILDTSTRSLNICHSWQKFILRSKQRWLNLASQIHMVEVFCELKCIMLLIFMLLLFYIMFF